MSKPLLDDAVLKLIDAKLLLNGHVTSKDIYRHLGLGRQKVSKVFQDYLAANPASMVYVPAKKNTWQPTISSRAFWGRLKRVSLLMP
ncbi:hypothetical protein [Vibrio owensii]|uniref:hypothetical protein n=1 Tax=Vibrio owensii TaxID=696485 RepID=UPI001F11F2E9|nr:hypothetical protein [Vibrio owensii]